MTQNQIEFELKAARLDDIEMKKNQASLRIALKTASENRTRHQRKQRLVRAIFSMGVTLGFVLGIGSVWMLQSPPKPTVVKVATNLGSIWCTYSDSAEGGNSVVWPPESTQGQNNFVKSAPGYGDKGYAVRFKGKAGKDSKDGFMGVSTILGPPCPTSGCSGVNIQKYSKIRFKMKGEVSGGELMLLISNSAPVETAGAQVSVSPELMDVYESEITEFVSNDWQTITLDLRSDFRFSDGESASSKKIEDVLADAKNVKWHVRNGRGADVDVWIDELEFF